MKPTRSLIAAVSATALAGLAGLAASVTPAAADAAACGQTIVPASGNVFTLEANLTCTGHGLVIGRDGMTLDLNGHTITGPANETAYTIGIDTNGKSNVTINGNLGGPISATSGSVEGFSIGIYVTAFPGQNTYSATAPIGGSNTVTNVWVENNDGKKTGVGDGILIDSSSNNQIVNNTLHANGPYDGIGIIGSAPLAPPATAARPWPAPAGNSISANKVYNQIGTASGVTIAGPQANNNRVGSQAFPNVIHNNNLDGVAVLADQRTGAPNFANTIAFNKIYSNERYGVVIFPYSTAGTLPPAPAGNIISNNQVTKNVFAGILSRSTNTQILNNTSSNNAGDGIQVDGALGTNNTIRSNTGTGNGHGVAGVFDGHDTHPNCDANTWSANNFTTWSPPCAKG